MENNKFDANGQVIFIEPRWVTGETCLFNISNKIIYAQAKAKLSKIRRDFILRLEDEGFVITYDRNDINDDTICLIMDELAVCGKNVDIDVYKKQLDKLMFESGGEKLNYPYTVKVENTLIIHFFQQFLKMNL